MKVKSDLPIDIVVWCCLGLNDYKAMQYINNFGIIKNNEPSGEAIYSKDNPRFFLEKDNENLIVYRIDVYPVESFDSATQSSFLQGLEFRKVEVGKIIYNQYNEIIIDENYTDWSLSYFDRNIALLYELNCRIISNMNEDERNVIQTFGFGLSQKNAYDTFMIFAENAHKFLDILIRTNCFDYIQRMFRGELTRNQLQIKLNKKLLEFSEKYKVQIPTAYSLFNKYSHSTLEKLAAVFECYDILSSQIWDIIDNTVIEDFSSYCNYFVRSFFFNENISIAISLRTNVLHFFSLYRDYLNLIDMEKRVQPNDNGYDLYPDDLQLAHDTASERSAILKESIDVMKKEEAFKKATEKYHHYEYEDGQYKVVVPNSPMDLVEESKILHHCVKTYIDYVCDESSKICLIRKEIENNGEKQLVPYMTIEIKNGKIVQAKKKCNEYPNEEDEVFLEKWCKEKNLEIDNF